MSCLQKARQNSWVSRRVRRDRHGSSEAEGAETKSAERACLKSGSGLGLSERLGAPIKSWSLRPVSGYAAHGFVDCRVRRAFGYEQYRI